MSKKLAFWIALVLLSLGSATFAIRNFSKALPIVSLDLRMDRSQALRSARALASRSHWGPESGFRQAASFGVDDTVQTFVELEGGGKEAFTQMIKQGLYAAYTWRVRHFKEGETHETLIRFTPAGEPYGFRERLRETDPGPSLPESDARRIAEHQAAEQWHVDLAAYKPAESSKEVRPSGRTDHTFVYERVAEKVKAGRYRLRLVVSGDRLTELTHFLKVPEAFARRYEEMRSANNAIAFGAVAAVAVLYFIGACIVGLFLLMRSGWLVWRPPLLWGVGIALVQALASINEWPLAWMRYDTALPGGTFLLQRVVSTLGELILNTFLLSLSFMAAESLGRKAFPNHPQLWRLWSREAASSVAVAGRTAGGYLLTGFEFGYIVGFYFLVSRLFHWWTPSDSLVDPDILATYVPWLSAVAPSLQAGFWEESLFRAVPIAGAALLGNRFGNRRAWIVAALLVEALVFGSAHANYASEPPYSRLVELIGPSLVWGIVYLNFGLLPSVITHFLFDLILFALPLFTSSAPGVRIDQVAVGLCALVPLGVVVAARLRTRAWSWLPDSLRNRAWTPPAPAAAELEPAGESIPEARIGAGRLRLLWALGLVGLVAWAAGGFSPGDAPPLRIGREEARARALSAVAAQGFHVSPKWQALTSVESDPGLDDRFVWRTAGRATYHALMGRYLNTPGWKVRIVTFRGDVAERAEEWQVTLAAGGAVTRVQHRLPQGRPAPSLAEPDARALAHHAVRERLGLDPDRLKEVSAVQSHLPARHDWVFTFSDTVSGRLPQGELRLSIEIAGDQVVDAYRFVYVPEDWQRKDRGDQSLIGVLGVIRALFLAVLIVGGAVIAVIRWSRGAFPVRFSVLVYAPLLLVMMGQALNNWPEFESRFSTAQPWQLQQTIAVMSLVLSHLIFAALIALLAGIAHGSIQSARAGRNDAPLALGIPAGATASGTLTLIALGALATMPRWPNVTLARAYVPVLAEMLGPASGLVVRSATLMIVLLGVHHLTAGWTRRRLLWGALLVLSGAFVGLTGAPSPALWLEQGLVTGLLVLVLYAGALRFDLAMVPLAVGTVSALGLIRAALRQGHPAALPGCLLGAALTFLVAWWWTSALRGPSPEPVASPVPEPSPV